MEKAAFRRTQEAAEGSWRIRVGVRGVSSSSNTPH